MEIQALVVGPYEWGTYSSLFVYATMLGGWSTALMDLCYVGRFLHSRRKCVEHFQEVHMLRTGQLLNPYVPVCLAQRSTH